MKLRSLLIVFLGVLLAGCASPLNVKPNTVWLGTYECGQGKTDLKLTIVENKSNNVTAIFHFAHVPTRVEGSFYLSGQYDPRTKDLVLAPGEWINRPSGYGAVGMEGKILENPVRYQGKIPNARCGSFRVDLDLKGDSRTD